MSISGLSGSSFLQSLYSQNSQQQSRRAQFTQVFQQLGQDLQSGNLNQAQADFATLTANSPTAQSSSTTGATGTNTTASTTPANTTNPIAQAFTQLSQDLQAGNLTAAQSDYATIQQDFQQQASAVAYHPHHHHHHGAGAANSSNTQNTSSSSSASGSSSTAGSTSSSNTGASLDQTIRALGQALQSGNLANAQQSYTSLLQEFQQSGVLGANTTSGSNSVLGSLVSATTATHLLSVTV